MRFWVRSFEMIRIRISDQMNRWIQSGQGFIGSIYVPSDPSDLGSLILIRIRIIPKERARLISFYRFSIRSCLKTVYNLWGTLKLDLPRVTSTSYGLQSFRCAAPQVWNTLPDNIRPSESVIAFRRAFIILLSRYIIHTDFILFSKKKRG